MDVDQEIDRLRSLGMPMDRDEANWREFLDAHNAAEESRRGEESLLNDLGRLRPGFAHGPNRQELLDEADRLGWRMLRDINNSVNCGPVISHSSRYIDSNYCLSETNYYERGLMRTLVARYRIPLSSETTEAMYTDDPNWMRIERP